MTDHVPVEVPLPAVPDRAVRARAAAAATGFPWSCSDATGRLLATLAAAKPGGRVGESGTGYGVGAAWLHSGMGPAGAAPAGSLVTVEREPERARSAAALFADDARVRVLTGDWRLLADHGPFDVLFCDGGGKRDDPDAVVDLLAPGGVLVLDDLTPTDDWPPTYEGQVDTLRVRYLTHPALVAVQLAVAAAEGVVVAVRR
ncbi:O-methyltransferase [Kineosporia sp. R_H_3]|uniref:O-methyltransferase n=1 Tax=Kineosporia sp. R_H_3 TaxID=1961848 RepID=UPI000B4B9AD3|nr:class I SAM-dependent methyltransferase [Kineosporia sp. R_H_3]